ncbi:hypothetical protein [Pseudoduganella sp. UC29_71]|uniref:hypothetical protein n=1 Tax=Pseudoduganella sp. UC29_71 TaxID=3350174 RepID=UPI00366D50A6
MPNSDDQAAAGLPSRYRVIARGPLPGQDAALVAARLAALFQRSVQQMHALLAAPFAIVKKGIDLASAQQFTKALAHCGCACHIEAEAPDFSALQLKRFASPGIGIVLDAPTAWRDSSDGHAYQLFDLAGGSQLTAIGVANTSLTVHDWNELRLSKVAEEMPWLKQVKRPYRLEGENWGMRVQGVATEYQGAFPGLAAHAGADAAEDGLSHHLVLSLWTRQALACLTIHAPAAAFRQNEALYRWLLQTQLSVQEHPPGPVRDEAMARWLKYNKVAV